MPGGVGNYSRAMATTQSTSSPPIVPEVPAATSVVAGKALNVAATMLNNLLSTAIVSEKAAGLSTSSSQPTTEYTSTFAASSTSLETTSLLSSTATVPPPPVPEQHAGVFIYGFCLVLIPTATILGNLLVIISVLRFKALHSAINFLILGLAVADLLVAAVVMPFAVAVYVQGGYWFFGPLMCDIYSASDVACSTASILLLAVISFDRYRAVSRPIQYSRQSQNIRRVIMILIGIWLISLALASPIVLGANHRPEDASPYECRFYNPEFSIGSSIVSFVIPCFIVLFVYIRIMMALQKREKAAKMRRLANQQETNKKAGDISNEENDAGEIVTAPVRCFVAGSANNAEELCSLLVAINVLMLALPTIQKRMRRYERHEKAIKAAGEENELFSRASFARALFMPRVGMLSAQSYLMSSVSSPSTNMISPSTNKRVSPRLSPSNSPMAFKSEAARRKSLANNYIASPALHKERRPSKALSPATIASATHALSSACVSAVAAVAVSESPSNNEPTPRRCRFSSFAETKEYDVDSEDDKRDQAVDEEEDEQEAEEEEESGSDDFYDEDFSSDDRSNNLSAAKQLISRVGSGIQNLTNAAAATIGSKHRLSLAEPNIRRFAAPVRKFGMNQASSARNSFLGHSTPQALGLSSLVPLLASHESFRRCSDSISQTVRSNSTAGMEGRQTSANVSSNANKIQNELRPFSTSPTVRPEAWQTLTPRASPAIFPSPTHSALLPHRESDTAKSSISATSNSYFTFSTCGGSLSARSSINTNFGAEELVLSVTNLRQEPLPDKDTIPTTSVLSPTETTTTTIPAEPSTPIASPTQKSPIHESCSMLQLSINELERQSSTIRKSRYNREKIWQARARFFRSGNYASEPVIHSKSPVMLRRFVLDVENDPTTQATDDHDVGGGSSSPLSSSDSLSDNLHVVTNDFVSEAPTSMSRKSSLDSSGVNHSPPTQPKNRVQQLKEKSPKQDSMIRRFKSFHVNHRALPLPNVDVSKATAELLRHLSRKSPRLFRPSASPSSTNSVPVTTTTNHVEKQPVRKKLSYTSGDVKITRPYGLARRKSESYASSVRVKHRGTFRLSDVGPVRILNNHNRQKKPSPIQEIGIPLISNSIDEPPPERKTSKRYPGALTSSALCEDMDYVDMDGMQDSQLFRPNNVDPDSQNGRQRSPVPYSEETTSSATDINLTSPIQSFAAPIVPPLIDVNNFYTSIDADKQHANQMSNHGSLIIQNQTVIDADQNVPVGEGRKISRSNGKGSNRDETSSPSVTFKIPGKEVKPMRRLSSAASVLETTNLLEKPPMPNSQSSNSMTGVSPKTSKTHTRSYSQKLSTASSNLGGKAVENSLDSHSSSQATNTTAAAYASTPTPTKNLESKLKMVKRAINRKESSLKRKVNKAQRKEKRATKTLGIVVGIFLICWVPFFSINILNAICILIQNPSCEVGFSPFFYSTWLGYTNSFVNPIIYGIFNTEFRRAFRSLLVGRTSGRRHRARHV